MVWGKPGHAPVIHPAQTIAVNYCGLQPVRMLGWATPAHHEKVQPHILGHARLACSMTGDIMGAPGVLVVMLHLGSLSGRGEKFVKS